MSVCVRVFSVCLSDPYVPLPSASTAAGPAPPPKGSTVRSSSTLPGTVDAAMPSQLPAENAAAAATGVSLPVSDGAQANGHTERSSEQPIGTAEPVEQQWGSGSRGSTASETQYAVAAVQSSARPPATAVCNVCGALQTAGTKHCYVDGRCVSGFDHHCVYLNTCVGRAQLPPLLRVRVLRHRPHAFPAVRHRGCWPTTATTTTAGAVESSHLKYPLAWLILLTIVAVLPFLCLASITSLQCFHCYLVSSRQTTYQFIVKRRQLGQQRWEQQQQQQWRAQGRAAGADGPVLNTKQQWEQAEWMRERQRQRGGKQQQQQ